MNLVATSVTAIRWHLRMLRHLMRAQAGRTLALIAAAAISRVTAMLAFMIPLKVLLLAGSDGVPRYMPFIDPALREVWIVGLSIGAVGCYVATLALDKLIDALSTTGGRAVLEAANDMAIGSNQHKQARDIFAGLGQVAADGLFAVTALAVMALLKPVLFAYLAALSLFAFAITAIALGTGTPVRPNRLARFILEQRTAYLDIWFSAAFLSGFLVLLVAFALNPEANLLVAIIAFLLLRRALRTAVCAIDGLAGLFGRRVTVEAMLLRSRQWLPQESSVARSVRDLFPAAERRQLMERHLGTVRELDGPPEVEWLDAAISNVDRFAVAAPLRDGTVARFLVHVVSPRATYLIENENLLFDHVPRERLGAPPLLMEFAHGDFTCQVFELTSTEFLTAREWTQALPDYTARRWSVAPSKRLLRAYRATHRLLLDSLDDDLLDRLAFAASRPEDEGLLDAARTALPRVRDTLAVVPLVIANPGLGPDTVLRGGDGALVTSGWGEWSLAPMGADMKAKLDSATFADVLEQMRKHRNDIPAHLSLDHVRFAALCSKLRGAVLRHRYREGLTLLGRIVQHPAMRASETTEADQHLPAAE